ncbi:DUF397 domain-containing protein [Kineosporia sp. J2-2]|uniref:DUF397 domain-containing protein n=1 Tax=Kineosporia corallincola TaxID=2835133 RepID=A0ABS5TIQ1_9ACTN|nr:DUF397 domain-containing protein [Kineosporia corallincola]MBT0770279.1 DUF397 domain-containing protein [Kineosporia corallincola]
MSSEEAVWVKASKSDATGDCVEMCGLAGTVRVRDSKKPATGVLEVDASGFAAWLKAARAGEFDGLLGG